MELILAGFLGAALIGVAQWVYFIRKQFGNSIEVMGLENADALNFIRKQFQDKIDTLARESAEAFSDQNLKFNGLRDHVSGQNVSIDLMQKELAEFAKNMDADLLQKLQDRVAMVEMAGGIRRMDSSKKLG